MTCCVLQCISSAVVPKKKHFVHFLFRSPVLLLRCPVVSVVSSTGYALTPRPKQNARKIHVLLSSAPSPLDWSPSETV